MLRRLLAAWVLLLLLFSHRPSAAEAPPPADPYNLTPVINAFRFDGVETTVEWATCGQVNAFYFPGTKTVVLCRELKAYSPGVIRYILAHELSHGVIMQLDVPYTTHHEGAADELAALMLIWIGQDEDVLAGAEFWSSMGRKENPYDDHYGDWRRWFNLSCLVIGSRNDGIYANRCTTVYRRATSAWVRLLKME